MVDINELEKRIYTLETQVNGLSHFVSKVNLFMERSEYKKAFCSCKVCKAIIRAERMPVDVK
jgi:hypothetical protein